MSVPSIIIYAGLTFWFKLSCSSQWVMRICQIDSTNSYTKTAESLRLFLTQVFNLLIELSRKFKT